MDKSSARRRIRSQRASGAIIPDHAGHCRHLARFLAGSVTDERRIVIYDALADEVDLSALVATHPDPTARFAITRTPAEGHRLTVHPWGGPSERHRHGYRQPALGSPQVDDGAIGTVVVPGLAFDRQGARLGRGGGYYDRLLARLGPGVLRVGVTAGLVVDRLPVGAHDVAMTHLATAEGVWPVPLEDR